MSLNWVEDEWQLDLTFITGEVSYLICPIRMFRAPLKPSQNRTFARVYPYFYFDNPEPVDDTFAHWRKSYFVNYTQ